MWPYSELGIDPTDDERAIKRAYAVKLRQNRPDENPRGFQRLHEAYQAALQRCQGGDRRTVSTPVAPRPLPPLATEAGTLVAASTPPAVVDAPPIAFDADAFLREMIARADASEPGQLRRWLESREALWALSLKARIGQRWLAVLHQSAPPMPEACFDEILAFFRLDHAGAVRDPLVLAQRRQRMHLAWYLAPERRNALAALLGARTVAQRKETVRALDWLQQPFRWPVALRRALLNRTANTVNDLIRRLAGKPPVELPPPVNPQQLAFWTQAAQSSVFNRVRAAVFGARVAGGLLLGLLGGLGMASLSLAQSGRFAWNIVWMMEGMVAGLAVLDLALNAWTALTRWQRQPRPLKGVLGWLHLGLVPLLVLGGTIVINATGWPMAGWVAAIPALWLALARALYGRKMSTSLRTGLRVGIFLIYPVASLVANAGQDPVITGDSMAGVALLTWAIDAWYRMPRQQRVPA